MKGTAVTNAVVLFIVNKSPSPLLESQFQMETNNRLCHQNKLYSYLQLDRHDKTAR